MSGLGNFNKIGGNNPVNTIPVGNAGNFQLQRQRTGDLRKCVVTTAKRQCMSLFMRDLYGKVNKDNWFK